VFERINDAVSRIPLRQALLGLLLWSGLALFFATEAALRQFPARQPTAIAWSDALLINFTFYWLWGALSVGVLALSRRFPLRGERRWRHVALHVALGLAVASIHLLLAEMAFELIRVRRGASISFLEGLGFSFRNNFHVNLLTYWAIVAVRHLRDYDQGLREKELMASRLREQLVSAELAALRMQLHPHFLFNALHSISALVHDDPQRADVMLVRLSELLRRSLAARRDHEITLARELEFVRGYLELVEMRYGDRLRAEIAVPAALLGGLIPSGLLQPLVENAVVHGVEPSPESCVVAVRARLVDDRLQLEVENGLPERPAEPSRGAAGIGLENVRARLEQLYGDAASLALEIDPGRRAMARIVLPFREAGTNGAGSRTAAITMESTA
jgi:hypothetical protein